jgi:hypothetical protein
MFVSTVNVGVGFIFSVLKKNKPTTLSWIVRLFSHMGNEKLPPLAAVENIGQ